MKRKKVLLLSIVFSLLLFSKSYASDFKVMVNNKYLQENLVNENGRVLVPFRSIFNALEINDNNINWDQNTKTVKVYKDNINIELSINNKRQL